MHHTVTAQERTWLLREKHGGIESPEFARDLERLALGEPLAYVIGHVPFLDASIDLSHKPLIPRVETEHWVKDAITALRAHTTPPRTILDLFAGSGCIGTALAQAFPDATIHFGELDPDLIEQIKINLARNAIPQERARIISTDVFSNITDTYDAIFANPPYIPASRESELDASVTAFEPHRALFAGPDGLSFIRPLIAQAPQFLHPGGSLFIEFDSAQKDTIEKLAHGDASWKTVAFMRDQYDAWRAVELTRE